MRYGECFSELSILEDEVLARDDQFLIPKKLRVNVFEAAHQGHPRRD